MGRRTLQEVWRERARKLRSQADMLERLASEAIVIDLTEPGADEALRKLAEMIDQQDSPANSAD